MNVQDFPPTTDDSAGQALIAAAGAVLAKRRSDIPGTLLAELLGAAVPDDLQRYRPDAFAAIAERSWSLFAERKAGAPKISFAPAPATPTVAVLDIINDDMPFLLDSVLGELNQHGLDIRLLVHPVFAVERDARAVRRRAGNRCHGWKRVRRALSRGCGRGRRVIRDRRRATRKCARAIRSGARRSPAR